MRLPRGARSAPCCLALIVLAFAGLAAPTQAGRAPAEGAEPTGAPASSGQASYLPLVFHPASSARLAAAPRLNAPYFDGEVVFEETAIFWFGRVTPAENYIDVRVGYNASELYVHLAIFDRLVWYDQNPTAESLAEWDAATLYLDVNGNGGALPGPSSYRFVAQVNHLKADRSAYQAAYRGAGGGWERLSAPFTTETAYRGDPRDLERDAGWRATFHVPFASLGLAGPPARGSAWGLALAQHDRDDEAGTPLPAQSWPGGMDPERPSTWGQLVFGLPVYLPPAATEAGRLTIRRGLNGAAVQDGAVGGGTNCGQGMDFFAEWGEASDAGAEQVNVQNQFDVADWPCFAKFYLTFPLDGLPRGKKILSATLTLYQFGNAGGGEWGEAPASLIQALVVSRDWQEASLTWNNAPPPLENVSRAWVGWLAEQPPWPGVPRSWDVSLAVAQAYAAGEPLRLALYSADRARHSGKYFSSSDAREWNAEGRPTLEVIWANP